MADQSPSEQPLLSQEGKPQAPAPIGRTLLFLSVALGLGTALCWCLRENAITPGTGTVSGRPSPLLSDWTGRIELFWVKAGDSVQAGDPIAILINEQLLLQIDRQKRELAEIQLALDRAEHSLDRQLTERLDAIDAEIVALRTEAGFFSTGASASESRLQELEALRLNAAHEAREQLGLDSLREELLKAEAKLQQLESLPKQITLPATATGKVKRLLRKPGERVVPGTPILELANVKQPYLVVEMPEPLAKRFALGDTIPLNFPGSENAMGRVANMHRLESRKAFEPNVPNVPKAEATVRVEIEPKDESWPEIPLESKVTVRTADSRALNRRVN